MSRREFLVFEVAARKFAVPLSLVEEVVPSGSITPVPKSPHFLLGLTAVRGKVMGVIDASRRYGLGASLSSHFVVCRVRGNLTAIAVDRPVVAGSLAVRELGSLDTEVLREEAKVDQKFVTAGCELLEDQDGVEISTGVHFLEVDADLFVSAEMALRVGEV